MNLRDLGYLVAVADERHFGRAAAASFVSQPTLSTQIKKLERELGVELLERNHRHVMLTPAGERIVERARIILREVGVIHDLAQRARDPESGTVRVGLFPTLGPYLLPHIVPKVRQRFPELELLLVEETTDRVLQHLRDGSLDAGVLALPINDDLLHVEPLFEEDFVLAVPSGHHLAESGPKVPISSLARETVLLLEEGHCLREHAISACGTRAANAETSLEATSLHTLIQMVEGGLGVTLLPEMTLKAGILNGTSLVARPFATDVPARTIALAARPTSAHRRDFELLAEFILARMREMDRRMPPRRARRQKST